MKKYLKKQSAFLTDTTISDAEDLKCIQNYKSDLLDETKFKRFTLGGNDQGVYGSFGYATDDDEIKFFVVELYSFQSLPSKEIMFEYENVYVAHELNKNGKPTGIYYMLPGGNAHPKTLLSNFNNYMDITSKIRVNFCGKTFDSIKKKLNL